VTCYCDFCQKRTGSVVNVGAQFAPEQIVAIAGETKTFNGLEIDGIPATGGVGIDDSFCATCGSTVYRRFVFEDMSITGVAVGNFVDPDFPAPTVEYFIDLSDGHGDPDPPDVDDAEAAMLAVAAQDVEEAWFAAWLKEGVTFE
jgi:hypothetical protein